MCGVAGIFAYGDSNAVVDRGIVRRMLQLLQHRGPDDEGLYASPGIVLGHRRLAIVDLSPTGRQPMIAEDGTAIAYNGEAYNHQRFRPRLQAKGTVFRGLSDTETILQLLRQDGPRALEAVAGIFALAFWDAPHRRLVLARDPLGVKQIYYHDDGQRIVFASEIKALIFGAGVASDIDPQALNEYLHFHTPLFERTLFRSIRQVGAGEYLEVTQHGSTRRQYWNVDGFSTSHNDAATAVSALGDLLHQVVSDQRMSDVPVGAFFSGGIDSTTIAAFAKDTGEAPPCFGVHFSGQGVIDERPFQEAAAASLGLQLELTTLDGSSFPEDLQKLMYFQDQPVIGAAMLPMYYVSRLAAQQVKVCLGGQAADEMFGGYARYALLDPSDALRSVFSARFSSRHRAHLDATPIPEVGGNLRRQLFDANNLRRLLRGVPTWWDWRQRYFSHFAKVSESAWKAVLTPGLVSRGEAFDTFAMHSSASPAQTPLDKVFHWEMRTYLTGLFQQDDRMSMANSLESRVPFADPRLVRFALQQPAQFKLRAGASKWMLRQAVADRIPAQVLNRRKVGFDTPADRWMRTAHSGFVRELLLSSRARSRGFYDCRGIEALLASPAQPHWFDRVWKLCSIETWARIFIDGDRPVVDEPHPASSLRRVEPTSSGPNTALLHAELQRTALPGEAR